VSASFQPVFLIGAARSGTKLLRDLIGSHPAAQRVPYDINFIWRLGNEACPHDEFISADATPQIAARLRSRLAAFADGAPLLVEKTVSNSLRIPFVQTIFPEAKYVFLFRDGRDAVESAYRQWTRPPDWKYLLRKAGSFPFLDAPGYAWKYFVGLLRQRGFGGRRTPTWGPRYEGIERDLASRDLIEVCALQWSRSVGKTLAALDRLDETRVMSIRYEDFVCRPQLHLTEIAAFLGLDPAPYRQPGIFGRVSTANIGKGWRQLTPAQRELSMNVIRNPLNRLGYAPPEPFQMSGVQDQVERRFSRS
jgi:hypothetical protein